MTFKKILVPVDFSEFSDTAFKYALSLAEKFCSNLTLLHMISIYYNDTDNEATLRSLEDIVKEQEKRKSKLMDAYEEEGKSHGVTVDSKLVRGFNAADIILEYIEKNDFDLTVIGTHGRTGFKKWILGSVTEKVVRLSPIPVITIHKDYNKRSVEKILVPVDFSESSKIAVDWGIVTAQEFKAKLHFLHSVDVEVHPEYYLMNSDPIFKKNPELAHHLNRSLIKFTGIPKNNATYVLTEGKAYKEIKKYEENNQIDLIVMAIRGMSKMEHFLLGSTAERVVRIAPCPVLTVGRNSRGGPKNGKI